MASFLLILITGAFGVVMLCVLPQRRKPLAVKCMDLTEHSGSIDVFKKEVSLQASTPLQALF